MEDDLVRLESAVSATASGNLTWERWPLDVAVALGFSGQRNPLGFAVVRYLSDPPSAINTWGVILVLAKEMERRGVGSDGIKDRAMMAFDVWHNGRCPVCSGRGVINIEQHQCRDCGGTGKRNWLSLTADVRTGIECLEEAERWMERQLEARLKRL